MKDNVRLSYQKEEKEWENDSNYKRRKRKNHREIPQYLYCENNETEVKKASFFL